jgi:transcriptional regulator with XRE-family HTH domain
VRTLGRLEGQIVTSSRRGDYHPAGNAGGYAAAVGARLRALRHARGLSLTHVQQLSGGRIKRVVIGSYERGDRVITLQRLARIAEFYDVPVAELLPDSRTPTPAGGYHRARVSLHLPALRGLAHDPEMRLLARYAAAIQTWRGDWGACVLSIRATDTAMLAIMHERSPAELLERWATRGVLATEPAVGGG